MRKELVKYEIDGGHIYVESERLVSSDETDINRDDEGAVDGGKFDAVVSRLQPAADSVLKVLKKLDQPSEIQLEMGVKLAAKTGVILASADSEATFKVTVKWEQK